jgi:hypothetical protein
MSFEVDVALILLGVVGKWISSEKQEKSHT